MSIARRDGFTLILLLAIPREPIPVAWPTRNNFSADGPDKQPRPARPPTGVEPEPARPGNRLYHTMTPAPFCRPRRCPDTPCLSPPSRISGETAPDRRIPPQQARQFLNQRLILSLHHVPFLSSCHPPHRSPSIHNASTVADVRKD